MPRDGGLEMAAQPDVVVRARLQAVAVAQGRSSATRGFSLMMMSMCTLLRSMLCALRFAVVLLVHTQRAEIRALYPSPAMSAPAVSRGSSSVAKQPPTNSSPPMVSSACTHRDV